MVRPSTKLSPRIFIAWRTAWRMNGPPERATRRFSMTAVPSPLSQGHPTDAGLKHTPPRERWRTERGADLVAGRQGGFLWRLCNVRVPGDAHLSSAKGHDEPKFESRLSSRALCPGSSHPRTPKQEEQWIPVTSTGMTTAGLV